MQGAFAAMYRALFSHADSLGVASWSWFGRQASIQDSAQFESCVHSAGPIPALAADTVDARRLGIRGTPLMLVGDLLVEGVPTGDSLAAYIQRARKAAVR